MRRSRICRWAIPAVVLLVCLCATSPLVADVAPYIPPKPSAPQHPEAYQSIIAGVLLTAAVVAGGFLLIRRGKANVAVVSLVVAVVVLGVARYVDWTSHLHAEYERKLHEYRKAVRKGRNRPRRRWRDYDVPEKRRLPAKPSPGETPRPGQPSAT